MNIGVTRWDAAELLTSDEMIVAYVDVCIDEARGDPTLVLTLAMLLERAAYQVMKGLRLRFRVEIA